MTKTKIILLLLLLVATATSATAKFVQEVELKDGTVLVGYVYRQRPGKFLVFYTTKAKTDPHGRYRQQDNAYTLPWEDVKYIRRSTESAPAWCNDKVTLRDGRVFVGQIEEQQPGVQMKMKLNETGGMVNISYSKIRTVEKTARDFCCDLWLDRHYTDRLLMTDNTIREGLIVMRFLGDSLNDCYVELMHSSGNKERIYFPDVTEYIININ